MKHTGITIGIVALTGTAAMAQTFNLGMYEGQWDNLTFGSSGDAFLDIQDMGGGSLAATLDLEGSVFGQGNPDPLMFTAMLAGDTVTLDPFSDMTFGDVSGGIDDMGNLSIDLVNAAGGAFALVTLRGTAIGESIQFDYEIFTAAGTAPFAVGEVNLRYIPAPGPLALFALGGFIAIRRVR